MDATLLRRSLRALTLFLLCRVACGATHTTENFVVTAPSQEIARKVANCAEFWRQELAMEWLGETLPNWYRPCPISVKVGQMGAGGSTTFTFENGEVFGWRMEVQGSLERILDSVIPHEVNHTIFASYFRRPVPRWADEGAATLVEHESERARQVRLLEQVIRTTRRIPLDELLKIREYPSDMQQVLTLYAEGYSLAEFLVGQKGSRGKSVYLQFLADAHQQGWETAIRKHYGFQSIGSLEQEWTDWILAGSPSLNLPDDQLLADRTTVAATTPSPSMPTAPPTVERDLVIRSQSPEAAARNEPLPMTSRPLRTVAASQSTGRSDWSADNRQSLETRGDVEDLRSRAGDRQETRPSLPSASLSPTADGIFSDPRSKSYGFPPPRGASRDAGHSLR